MSLNRRRSPRVSTISGVKLPDSEKIFLDNGLPVPLLHGSETEAMRLDICFNVGRQHEHKRMAARATASMLKEGSSQYSGKAFGLFPFFLAGLEPVWYGSPPCDC